MEPQPDPALLEEALQRFKKVKDKNLEERVKKLLAEKGQPARVYDPLYCAIINAKIKERRAKGQKPRRGH